MHAQHAGSIVWRPAGRDSSFSQNWRLREVRDTNSPNPSEIRIRVARYESGSE